MAQRPPLSSVPDPSALQDATGRYIWGYFKRMDSDPPSVHVLPLSDGTYEKKRMENGEPLFIRVANAEGDPIEGKKAVAPEEPKLD
jgi:hypothetical protein